MSADGIIVRPALDLELSRAVMTVQFRRQPRAKCATCHLRRVLYRVGAIMAGGHGETKARCLACWAP